MIKIRCPVCGKTLLYFEGTGRIEIKCTRKSCGKVILFQKNSDEESVKHTVIRE